MIEIPLPLRHALESGQCVLFLGAGAGGHLRGADGTQAPDATTLAQEIAKHFGIDTGGSSDLAKVAEYVEITKGRIELETFLRCRLDGLDPDEHLRWIPTVRWKAIYTTNYDQGIERAYSLAAKPLQTPHVAAGTSDLTSLDSRFEIPIYHLHGTLFGQRSPQLILTQSDYARFREGRRMMFELLKNDFATSTLLYVGYSNRDPNWQMVLEEIAAEFYPSAIPTSYRVAPGTQVIDKALLKAKGVETIDCTFEDFVKAATIALATAKSDATSLKKAHEAIPSDLNGAFDQNPAATARLLNSWTYVNQAAFSEPPNTNAFLRGDRANWGLIGKGDYFERDVEEQLYDDVLEYVTGGTKRPNVEVVLGSAGYGTSTLLMTIAGRIAIDRAGPAFMLRPGATILEGDVEFAAGVLPGRPLFIVDDSADHAEELYAAIHRLRNADKPAMFILGERLNEWRQGRSRITGKEVEIEALSRPEVQRLINFLAAHNALGALEPLSRELQTAAIENKHGKQLLVVMKESTEGKSFDAILEDEFQGIQGELARRAYLYVCCFYQHGAYVRDTLLAALLRMPITTLYETTKGSLDGVVAYDCIDEANGRYAARARHRTIARVVWDRCGSPGEKEDIILSALQALNLNYRTDLEAFESFIRSDNIVDEIRSLDGRIRFFDTACQKDPESPYVRQHYARMLDRAGKSELALSQIEEALRLNPSVRVLYHTKGVVLAHLAKTIPSVDLARKRMAQSEEAFRRGISLNKRDDYCYSGLAELYLEWAKRTNSGEIAVYITKAENAVSEGLRNAKSRESLWIVSSEIEKWLGHEPSRIGALERAVSDSQGSVIARYLLGRAYRSARRPADALKILEPVVKGHSEEFRAATEYTLALLDQGESWSKAIAIMRLSSHHGYSDPKFIATLGGMLFMREEFSEAAKVFGEAEKREFTAQDMRQIRFRPRRGSADSPYVEMKGKVIVVKPGYALIEAIGYPPFIFPGSKFGSVTMHPGMDVRFQPAFSARGAVADRVEVDEPES